MMREQIYPGDGNEAGACAWLLTAFEDMRDYFGGARTRGYAMVTYYT